MKNHDKETPVGDIDLASILIEIEPGYVAIAHPHGRQQILLTQAMEVMPGLAASVGFELDGADGVIGRRVALDLSPVKAQKRTVKLFDLDGMACDKIGSFLINDVMECKAETGAAENCLQRLTTTSLSNVKLSK